MKKDPNKNANKMGGPSFHPQIDKEKASENGAASSKSTEEDGAILRKDQVPPL